MEPLNRLAGFTEHSPPEVPNEKKDCVGSDSESSPAGNNRHVGSLAHPPASSGLSSTMDANVVPSITTKFNKVTFRAEAPNRMLLTPSIHKPENLPR
jgi:hypothetical protein